MQNEFIVKPYKLENQIQHYDWGMKGKQAYIPKLLGIKPDPNQHYAELWMGAHPEAPSKITLNSRKISLNKAIEHNPKKILGENITQKYQKNLPFLFKVLSAAEALSIQTHPNKKTAERLHKEDPQHYPDANHKPEIAIALDSLDALVGFRPIIEIIQVLNQYTELASFIGKDKVSELMETMKNSLDTSEILQDVFSSMMSKAINYPEELENLCTKLEKQFKKNIDNNRTKDEEREKLFLELKNKYGSDVGLLVIFFLNLMHLEQGEAVYLDAGILHAYLRGNIVECMANSDNVVRAGLTPKYKDIETLVNITKYNPGKVEILNSKNKNEKEISYSTPAPEFDIERYKLNSKENKNITTINSAEILLQVQGKVLLKSKEHNLNVKRGESILIPAAMEEYELCCKEDSFLFRVKIGEGK